LEYPRIHKVLEIWIGKVRLHKLRLLFKHSGNNVDDVIIESYLCYLLITIADSIDEINTSSNASWKFLNLTLYLITVFPFNVAVSVIEVFYNA
jgi:hypothetical protein